MCGRFSLALDKTPFEHALFSEFDLDVDYDSFALPRYNIAPSQTILALIHDGEKYRLGPLKWGFRPRHSKDSNFTVINARSETVEKRTLFKQSFATKRCLILADGFYEWKKGKEAKVPMRFTQKENTLITMAGIYTPSKKADGHIEYTVAILTHEANDDMNGVHSRMPVILTKGERHEWVHPKNNGRLDELKALTDPKPAGRLIHYPVDSIVNNPKNDTAKCLDPTPHE